MLLLLTGDIQIGKTRWLQRVIALLQEQGVEVCGVLAPGMWVSLDDPRPSPAVPEGQMFKKVGIENTLLPQGETIPFGRWRVKRPPVEADATERARMGWEIFDEAIDRVNAHLEALGQGAAAGMPAKPRVLVLDEIGRMELLDKGGLTAATALLDAGPDGPFALIIAVVRQDLLDMAHERFAPLWQGQMQTITPGDDAQALIWNKTVRDRS